MRFLRRVRRPLRSEDGFTLIEVLVVVAIIGIMAAVTIQLITAIFDSNIRARQYLDQQTTVESLYGFLASRVATAQRPIGTTKTSGCAGGAPSCVQPLSLAGDQMVFTSGGYCYRIFYVKNSQLIKAMVSPSCDDTKIKPVRGPNEFIPDNTTYCNPSSYPACNNNGKWDAGEPYYDQALDLTTGPAGSVSFPLAAGVVSARPGTAPSGYPSPLRVFDYLNESNTSQSTDIYACVLKDPANSSNPCAHTTWYDDVTNRDTISSVDVYAYVDPPYIVPGGTRIGTRVYRQNLSLQQVCAVVKSGASGTTPGTVSAHEMVQGSSGGTWQTVTNPGSGSYQDVNRQAAVALETPTVTTQNAWIQFNGSLLVRSAGSGGTVRVRLYSDESGSFQPVQDSTGRQDFFYRFDAVGAGGRTIDFSGAFKIPDNGGVVDPPGTKYKLKIAIGDTTGNIDYTQDINNMWLDDEVVAY